MTIEIKAKNGRAITIRTDIRPGDISAIIDLHSMLYAQEYGFDHTFEPYVAQPIREFVIKQSDRDRLWIVTLEEKVMGSIAIVATTSQSAQLRWLILHPDLRGCGVGMRLLEEALSFCRACGFTTVFLWTIDFLAAALKLYLSAGFRLTDTKSHKIWGQRLTEARYELSLNVR